MLDGGGRAGLGQGEWGARGSRGVRAPVWLRRRGGPGSRVGLLTDVDLRRARQDHSADSGSGLPAADLMTIDPITVNGDVLVVKALEQMEHNRRKPISVLPVVGEQKRLLGLLRLHDLVQAGLA